MSAKDVPYNVEAEAAVIGALLIDPEAYKHVSGIISPDHFYLQKHKWIFTACKKLYDSGDPVDFVTLTTELEKRGQLDAVGGGVYISQLLASVPSAMRADSYARLVYDAYRRRELLDLVSDVAKIAYRKDEDITTASDYIQNRMAELFATQSKRDWQPFSEVAPTIDPITWLWPSWIPVGMITLLGAVSGSGKSMIALDFCMRVMHGMPFPTGPSHKPRNVVYVDAEVSPQTMKERTGLWNMDTSRLYIMWPRPNDVVDFYRPEYREQLRAMVADINPGLVVIDSLSSVNSKGENSIEDIRQTLSFLNEVAVTYKTSVVLIHHLRKRGSNAMLQELTQDDLRGSGHIVAMSRSVIGVSVVQTGADIDPNGPRKLSILKTNLCRTPDPVGCEFLPSHNGGVIIHWNETAPTPYREPTKLDECTKFLENLLRDTGEPISPKEIIAIAREDGFSRDMVFQARKNLGKHVQNTTGYKDPANQWEWIS